MTPDRAPLGKMLAVFIGTLIAGNLLVLGIEYALPDLAMPSSLGIVFVMVAAMQAGQLAVRNTGQRLTFGETAVFALAATVLSIGLSLGLVWGALAWVGLPFTLQNLVVAMTGEMVPDAEIMDFLPWIGVFVAVLSLVVCYFAAGWGARTQLKLQDRLAARGK